MIWVVLLRAVNLAGHNLVSMTRLREFFDGLGMEDVRTLLQSGNAVFRSRVRTAGRLEQLLTAEAADQLGLVTEFFARTPAEWAAVMANNPFPDHVKRDPARVLVTFLKDAPDPARVNALRQAVRDREIVQVVGRHAYIVYPDGLGRSRLTSTVIESRLATRGTARNWNTVSRLAAMLR